MKSQSFALDSNGRSTGRRHPVVPDQFALQVLNDADGSAVFGWVANAVFYTRFQGALSTQTGHAYAIRLGVFVAQTQSLCFFCDTSDLKYCDLLARSALARVILANRRKFTSLTILACPEGLSPTIRALVATLGEPIEVLSHKDAFEAHLLRRAPLALRSIDPKTWLHVVQVPASPGL